MTDLPLALFWPEWIAIGIFLFLILFLVILFAHAIFIDWPKAKAKFRYEDCKANIKFLEQELFPELKEWQQWNNIGLDPTPFIEAERKALEAEEIRKAADKHRAHGYNKPLSKSRRSAEELRRISEALERHKREGLGEGKVSWLLDPDEEEWA